MPPVPPIAVVVPTRGRPERLARLLAALEGPAELVVVVDGPDPATDAVLHATRATVLRHAAPRGPAAARNTGWRAARAPLIAFLDDDCVPTPGWLEALAAPREEVVVGRVTPEALLRGPLSRSLTVEAALPWFPSANVRYPRALLERLGGFDERFPFPAGEDTDLGWRALEVGATVAFASEALVLHAVHEPTLPQALRHALRWASAVRTVRRHPGLRAHLHRRVFWKPTHERLLLALAGVALAPRTRGRSLAVALPYAALRRPPVLTAVDLAELLAMLRGSASARTLLL